MSDLPSPSVTRDPTPLRPPVPVERTVHLPRPLTSFIGRKRDIEAVSDLCLRDGVQLVTITGPGGAGKTRLAIEVATRIATAFEDGVVFVSLAALRDPDLVPVTVAQALGIPTVAGQSLDERLRSYLRHKHLMLVIDNVEHLLTAGPAYSDLLAQHPGLTILCTSRTRLGLTGEHLIALSSLTSNDALELFIQQARAQDARFIPTAETAPIMEAICSRLDGLPLAIELAAARTNALPLSSILDRLDRRLPLLTGGPRDAPERQRTMHNAIAWSHDLLAPEEQAVFRRLSVCVGGFTLEAAATIGNGEDDALGLVDSLIAWSLVERVPDAVGQARFAMLETIREFGLERLRADGEDTLTRQTHARWFMRMAESEIPNFDGPGLRAAHDRVEADLDNCRVALAWTIETGDAETGIRLAGAFWRNWWYGHVTGGRPWSERVAEGRSWLARTLAFRNGLPVSVLAEAMAGAGHMARFQGDLDQGEALGEELLARSQAEDHSYGQFWALHLLGWLAESRGHDAEARRLYGEALAVAPSIRNPENHAAMTLVRMSGIADREGDLQSAADGFGEAHAYYRTCGNPAGIATSAFNLGRVMRKLGNPERAVTLLGEALRGFQGQRDLGGVHASLVELAIVALDTRRVGQAVHLLSMAQAYPGHPDSQPAHDRALAAAAAQLPEPQFSDSWRAGQLPSWDEAMSAIASLAGASHVSSPVMNTGQAGGSGLTPREREVLRLVAEGRSNRSIGEALSISDRTVENHVMHLLAKLDVESRTAAATYAVRHGLV